MDSSGHLQSQEKDERKAPVGNPLPVIVGAMVLDVHAVPSGKSVLTPGTTVPGKVKYIHGGVGRNVAECLAFLGIPTFLISVVGDDPAGDALVKRWVSLGLPTEGILRCRHVSTPVVSVVFDDRGELSAGVADVSTLEEHLSAEWVHKFGAQICAAPIVVLDGNLPPTLLHSVCDVARKGRVPVWFEPVSVPKSVRASAVLDQIAYISPNEAELVAMSEALKTACGCDARGASHSRTVSALKDLSLEEQLSQLLPHVERLLQAGVEHVVLTLGNHGALLSCRAEQTNTQNSVHGNGLVDPVTCDRRQARNERCRNCGMRCASGPQAGRHVHFPALQANVVNLCGAGDSLVAGTVCALTKGSAVSGALSLGMAVARNTVESDRNVPWEASHEKIVADARLVLRSVKCLTASKL